jgi:hypothetical protein
MAISGIGNTAATYAVMNYAARPAQAAGGSSAAGGQAGDTQLTLSDQALALAGTSDEAIQARLAAIKTKPAVERSSADSEFLFKHDSRLAEITAKGTQLQTAEDVDYMQKAGGFVNTMANLSPSEKQLYNDLVAKGDTDAVQGMNLIAMSRMMGGSEVTLDDGQTFDPAQTAITPENIRQLFSKMFAGSDAQTDRAFSALARALDQADHQPA